MLRNVLAFVASATVALGIFLFAESFSSSFQKCVSEQAGIERKESPKEHNSGVAVVIAYARCTAGFINAHNGGITALATLVIAAFTGTLWFATTAQAKLTRETLKLAKDEFFATHRPKIIVRNLQLVDRDLPVGKPIDVIFLAINIGESVGRLVEVRSATLVLPHGQILPTDLSFPFAETLDFEILSGRRELVPANGGGAPREGEPMQIHGGERDLYCIGTLAYEDTIGIRRETGFCRRYVPRADRWEITESQYEYAY